MLPAQVNGEVKDSSINVNTTVDCDLSKSVLKTIKPPVQTNEIFYDSTACLIQSSTSSILLYDLQQEKVIVALNSPPISYVMWGSDGQLVALMSKLTVTILNKKFV
ncbi:coatomer WD associated region-domain-containing protein [Pisolithus microcarpus]|nr:coatomer WD associated region-domain-containing protein [Pisolithus microcarpus]